MDEMDMPIEQNPLGANVDLGDPEPIQTNMIVKRPSPIQRRPQTNYGTVSGSSM